MRNQGWVEFFHALYLVWGTIGVLVSLNYGAGARENWATNGGRWATVPREWCAIIAFIITGCAADVWCLIRRRRLPPAAPSFTGWGYSPGHLLRFFIMMSFITSAIFGFELINVDRTHWQMFQLVLTSVAVVMSTTAGIGHLFIAWRFQPRRWRWTAAAAVLAVPIGMAIDHWLV